jgi:hemoglobin-like flavoprotein
MDDRQRNLIRESFEHVRPCQQQAGELFYRELFRLAPGLIPMFAEASLEVQSHKLMQLLAYVVDHLDCWPIIGTEVAALGERHTGYGVRSDHYAPVGAALIATLKAAIGDEFSSDAEEAWTELYTDLSLAMEKGAVNTGENQMDP